VLSLLTCSRTSQTILDIFDSGLACVRSTGTPTRQSFKKNTGNVKTPESVNVILSQVFMLPDSQKMNESEKNPTEGSTE